MNTNLEDAIEKTELMDLPKRFVIVINKSIFWRIVNSKTWAYDVRSLLRNVAPEIGCEIHEVAYYEDIQ